MLENGHSGADSSTYTISDASGSPETAEGTVSITVVAAQPPMRAGRRATMVGTAGYDVSTGTAGPDVIVAGRGERHHQRVGVVLGAQFAPGQATTRSVVAPATTPSVVAPEPTGSAATAETTSSAVMTRPTRSSVMPAQTASGGAGAHRMRGGTGNEHGAGAEQVGSSSRAAPVTTPSVVALEPRIGGNRGDEHHPRS